MKDGKENAMNLLEIIDLIVVILCGVTYTIMLYNKTRGDVLEIVSELIAQAEVTGLTGSEKMEKVVDALYDKVPPFLKKVMSKPMLERMAQYIFDWMRKYADNYLEAKHTTDNEEEKRKKLYAENAETTSKLVLELVNLADDKLREAAGRAGVEVTGDMNRNTVIQKIIEAALSKA